MEPRGELRSSLSPPCARVLSQLLNRALVLPRQLMSVYRMAQGLRSQLGPAARVLRSPGRGLRATGEAGGGRACKLRNN